MRLLGFVFFTVVLCLAQAKAADAETRAFGDWTAHCDAYENCAASTLYKPIVQGGTPAEYALEIGRQPYDVFWEISLVTYAGNPGPDASLDIFIDGQATRFAPVAEYDAFDGLNTYFLLGKKAQTVMDLLAPGTQLAVLFAGVDTTNKTAEFSLSGLTAALLWIDERQGRLGSERVAEAPPVNKTRVTNRAPEAISDALIARHEQQSACDPAEEIVNGADLRSYRLDATSTLHLLPCWSGAYNFGYFAYIQDSYGTEQRYFASFSARNGWFGEPALVNPWFDEQTGILASFYKGRGIGDCGTSGVWKWGDWGFKMLEYRAKDACDGVGNPGEFPLVYSAPGYVSDLDY